MKKDIEYKLSVMQAYKEGKTIENKAKYTSSAWSVDHSPVWNWDYIDYRVKEGEKEPTHRPYEDKNEFLVDSMNNWFYICLKKTGRRFMPTSVMDNGIEIMAAVAPIGLDWKTLFYDYEWDNGEPCGTKK